MSQQQPEASASLPWLAMKHAELCFFASRWPLESPSLVDWRKKGAWCCREGCIPPAHRVLPFAGLWLGTQQSTGSVGRSILLGADGEQKLGCIAGQMVHRAVCS